MQDLVGYAALVIAAAVFGWLLPALVMRAFASAMEAGAPRVTNYRGIQVPAGLGIAWGVWGALVAGAATISGIASQLALMTASPEAEMTELPVAGMALDRIFAVISQPPAPAIIAVVLFGLIDDVMGSSEARGFGGHLRELFSGKLSTGGLKVLGIVLVAFLAASGPTFGDPTGFITDQTPALTQQLYFGGRFVLAAMVIALAANLLNLLDLRPGRALKVYLAAGVPSAAAYAWVMGGYGIVWLESGLTRADWTDAVANIVATVLLVIGPALAVWRADLGERGVLGDSGSNAAGFLVGFLLAGSLSTVPLAVAAAALLALNLLSEKVSFSAVIEKVPPLRWLDGLGRAGGDGDGAAGSG